MILLIDNYDSFTYNLFHYIGELGAEVVARRNDDLTAEEALNLGAEGIVISPGPRDPDKAGICLDLIAKGADKTPILGVCLGHQSIGRAFGGAVVRAATPMHGKTSLIRHGGKGLFAGIPSPFTAARYHSLVVAPENLPACLEVTATSDDGAIQGLQHKQRPIFGVQFHPESIASEHGHALIKNFLDATSRKPEAVQ